MTFEEWNAEPYARTFEDAWKAGAASRDVEIDQLRAELVKALAAEQAKNVGLREALINLMKYNPRTRWVGGVEFGYEEPVGECLLKVLDKCDNALSSPSDTSALEDLK